MPGIGHEVLVLTENRSLKHAGLSLPERDREETYTCFLLRGLEVEVDNSLGNLCAICMTETTPDPSPGTLG